MIIKTVIAIFLINSTDNAAQKYIIWIKNNELIIKVHYANDYFIYSQAFYG